MVPFSVGYKTLLLCLFLLFMVPEIWLCGEAGKEPLAGKPQKKRFPAGGKWAVNYSEEVSPGDFSDLSLIVLEKVRFPLLEVVADKKLIALGYLNLGEIEQSRDYWEWAKSKGVILQENPNWQQEHYIDIRSKDWFAYVLEVLVPSILFKRYDGIFIDTLDSPIDLERRDKEKYNGMQAAAIRLIKAIRYQYPEILIMVNRAYEILPEIGSDIDMILGEGVFSTYLFKDKKYALVSQEDRDYQVNLLKEMKLKFPHLEIMTLDYWDPEDKAQIEEIYRIQKESGFNPYVSTWELNKVYP